MNTPWLKRIGKGSELCRIRHDLKYTGYAHYESEHRLREQKNLFAVTVGLAHGVAFVTAASTAMTPFKFFPGFMVALGSVALSTYVRTETENSRLEHADAAYQWMKLYDEATTLARKPSVYDMYTPNQFDTELDGIRAEKAILDTTMPKTINKDYNRSRAKLNETWEQKDWDMWARVY